MGGDFSDWFLPSTEELGEMYMKIGPGAPTPYTNIGAFAGGYWSSTEQSGENAWYLALFNGFYNFFGKDLENNQVRAIRAF